ncbi:MULTISPECIES: hypothetical protein [Serratia]|uniref:hypothetical protein n=1 Tax=Serratia TaxID=613 RepID=UPI0011D6B1E1|nr:hypothetical protein [Serratia nematodiphila]TXE56990.1 hypothetical protein FOT58_19715 [Serratia nematodiphila]
MTLLEWVKQQGGIKKCSEKHGFTPSALGAWSRLERFPSPDNQARIIQASDGLVAINQMRELFLTKKNSSESSPRRRRLQGSLMVRNLARLKQVFDELQLPAHRCNLNGPGIVARWATTNVTVQEVRNAVSVLEEVGKDAGSVEEIHAAIRDARRDSLRGLS